MPRYETLQPWYNLHDRDQFEGPLQDLARAEGLGVIPFYGLAAGFLTGKYRSKADVEGSQRAYRVAEMITPRGMRILDALDAVGERTGATPAQLSLAWLRAKGCIPIASATSLAQLEDLAGSVEITLDTEALAALDEASRMDADETPDRGPMPGSSS